VERSSDEDTMLSPAAAAARLGISVDTLRRWIADGRLTDHRTAGGHRRIDPGEVDPIALRRPATQSTPTARRDRHARRTGGIVGYARAHPGPLANTELRHQRERLSTYGCDEIITEIASALSDQRRGLDELLSWVITREVREVVITSTDRLAWFGTGFLNTTLAAANARLTVLDPSTTSAAAQDELLADLKTAVRTFTDRLWGTHGTHQQQIDELITRLAAS
jgi:excisionase family DNA binding protein